MIATLIALAAALPTPPPQEPGDPEVIYWDAWIDGALTGGVIRVDPTNPLHTSISAAGAEAAWAVTTIVDSGPPANRIDLVLVGDGYTTGELNTYINDSSDLVAAFFNELPLDAYSSYFNVHRVDVFSTDSGVDNDPVQGISKNTALDMGFWCSGIERLLCVNVSKALNAAGNAPGVDQVLALANSSMYGGAGYASSNLGTLAAQDFSAVEIAKHEFGHSFANLADEYDYGGPATWPGGEPSDKNVSIYDEPTMASLGAKWHLWLSAPGVGTFEGAAYSQFDIYRPTFNSKMRNLGRPFESVNVERFIVNMYKDVAPIDAASPPGVHPSNAILFVDPVDPLTHTLDVQWSLDGTPIPGATGTTLALTPLGLGQGTHTISATVVDGTALVVDEENRLEFMTETRSWTIADGPVNYCTAGITASGCQALLVPSGTPSASAPSGFTVDATGVEGNKDGLYFYGFNGPQANSWGSSYNCVVPPVLRTPLLNGNGTTGACDGTLGRDFNAYWSGAPAAKQPVAGQSVCLQLWFRDPANTSNQTTSLSDALEVVVQP
jgi:hypothetical protein